MITTGLEFLKNYIHLFITAINLNDTTAEITASVLLLIIILTLLILLERFILRRFFTVLFFIFSKKTKSSFDNYLFKSKFIKYTSKLIPIVLLQYTVKCLFNNLSSTQYILLEIIDLYLILVIIWIIRSFIRSMNKFLKELDTYKDKPVDSFTQVISIILWIIGITFIISSITNRSSIELLTGLGAVSAVILLVFKDTILGFVASIQVSNNDLVRIGDWITVEKFGADGTVIEINLTTVKVQNFDNTITTIPTYSLISDSLKNWRGMTNSKGRRIRRNIFIRQNSIKFIDDDTLHKYSQIQDISDYISHRQTDINDYNNKNNYDNQQLQINGRNQTNLGIFRKYCDSYLENHPAVNKNMIIMCRHLAPTNQGIPLEIYCFCRDKKWENYERIMADIFEHIIAAVPYFDLEIFELPTSLKNESTTI